MSATLLPGGLYLSAGTLAGMGSACPQMHGRCSGQWLVSIFVNGGVWWQGRCVTDDFGNLVQVTQ